MGVPFNFKCTGFGIYMCSRCGTELFHSDDKIQQHELPYPITFSKSINSDSLIVLENSSKKVISTSLSSRMTLAAKEGAKQVACGRCEVNLGYMYPSSNGIQGYYDIDWKSLLFVSKKQCTNNVPLSFLF